MSVTEETHDGIVAQLEARIAELQDQVDEIPDLLLIAHMQGAEWAKDRIVELETTLKSLGK